MLVRFLTCAVAALTFGAVANAGKSQTDLATVDRLFSRAGPKVSRSVHVVRLADGQTLYEQAPDQLLSPASVTKIVTTAAALCKFTPVHTFKTAFFHTGARKGARVHGDLVIVGDGDPYLVSEKLWQLAADIRHLGISEFTGGLVIDDSLFAGPARDEGRKGGAMTTSHAYDAPVSAFGVNFNTFAVAVAPGGAPGKSAMVAMDPYPLQGVTITNRVRTGKARAGGSLSVQRLGALKNGGERLTANGTIAFDAPMVKVYRSVGDPVLAAGEYVKAFLKAEGIQVRGRVQQGIKPQNAKPLLELEGYEMRRIVAGLNTFSNNYIADVLVKRLGAAFPSSGKPDAPGSGSYRNGLMVIHNFLKNEVGIRSNFVLENGSGLAIENRLSARQLTQLLSYVEQRMDVYPEFLASLPATGWDGTLKKRFDRPETELLKGLVRAKTGTLSEPVSVASLAGYFRHPKHGLVAFAILENGVAGASQPAITDLRARQDQVLAAFMSKL